jgi:hypothetical protein
MITSMTPFSVIANTNDWYIGFGSLESFWTSRLLHFSHCWQGGCSSSDCLCGSSLTEAADVVVSYKVPLTGACSQLLTWQGLVVMAH